MITDPWFYAIAIPAMLILGLAKGGFGIVGLLVVPILAIVISPVQAAGITLPILVLSDIVALISYRRLYDKRLLLIMLPGGMVGILIGWLTAAWVTEDEIRFIVGIVSVAFALNYWFRHRRNPVSHEHDPVRGAFWGAVAGFTSFVSHAGGPPFQIYAAPLGLDPRIFAGSSVIFFAVVNAVKTIPYFFLGQFSADNLLASAILLPVSIPATLFGVWLVKRFKPELFYKLVYWLIFLVGLFLVWESLAELF
jgi:uncharacterized membrane protein YfcA